MPPKRTLLLDPHFRRLAEIFEPSDLERLHALANVVWARDERAPADVVDGVQDDVWAIVAPEWRYGDLARFPRLRAFMDVGGRLPSPATLDYQTCFARGMRVLTCAPAFGPQVAEMALGMVLAATREIVDGHNAFVAGTEQYFWHGNVGTYTLFGQTVGFIGFGGLARALKPLLAPFGVRLLAYDPWLPDHYLRQQGAEPASLEALLAQSQVVFVLAIPSTENKALLDRAQLSRLQPGAVLALISRSHLVDFDALTELVTAGRFKAVIDVFPQEPLPADHPIRRAPGVVLSAHRAGSVARDLRLIGRMVVDDVEAMLAGLPPTQLQRAEPELVERMG